MFSLLLQHFNKALKFADFSAEVCDFCLKLSEFIKF